MATYLLNILPNKKLAFQPPIKILYQKDPSYSHLRVFGCLCYPLLPSTSRNKLQARSTPCVFLGYPSNHKGYKCYDLSSRKILISRHVTFDEHTFPFSKLHAPRSPTYDFLDAGITPLLHSPNQPNPFEAQVYPTPLVDPPAQTTPPRQAQQTPLITLILTSPVRDLSPHQSASPNRTLPSPSNSSPWPISPSPTDQPNSHSPPPPMDTTHAIPLDRPPHSSQMTTRSHHGIFKPRRILNLHTSSDNSISPLPTNPLNAFRDHNWKMAMKDEYDALIENKTWDLVPRPFNANII